MTTAADWYPKDLQSRVVMESKRRRFYHPVHGLIDIIYCMSCHRPQGGVNPECPSILALCQDCATKHGGLPLPKLTQQEEDMIGYREG